MSVIQQLYRQPTHRQHKHQLIHQLEPSTHTPTQTPIDPPTEPSTQRPTHTPIDPPTEPSTHTPTQTPIDPPTSTPEDPGYVVCAPGDDLIPNPLDCNSFYQCANGVPILFHCASDHEGKPLLVFNPILKQCVYPHEYDCNSTIVSPTDPSPTQTPIDPPTEPSTHTPTQTPPSIPEGPVCGPYDEYLPNPEDCSSFYQCAHGIPVLHHCAPTHEGEPPLNFRPTLNVCVWPEQYPCQCHKKSDSESCLSTPLTSSRNCSFCFDNCFRTDFGEDTPQCDSYENLLEAGCKSIDDPGCDSQLELRSDCENDAVICPGRKKNITVTFSIEKHPLDLYYLMDYSGSMHDDKNNLISFSSGLLNTLSTLTDDFHIGFGSVIDKPRLPFGNITEDDYSFHNNLPLTSETHNFVEKVSQAPILLPNDCDIPEAHADAMSQVIECTEAIGWRTNARRVVLVATDAIFHTAGDGAKGNIHAPYVDGCYLDERDYYYTEELRMDYPSVEQLARAYSRKQATASVIFASTTNTIDFYQRVAAQFKSAYVAILNTDSSNILDVVKTEFAKIQSRMEIEKSDTNDTVHFKYYSNCMGTGGARETKICESLPSSGRVTFNVEIDLEKCPTDENDTGMDFILNPVGLPRFFKVKLQYLCKTNN